MLRDRRGSRRDGRTGPRRSRRWSRRIPIAGAAAEPEGGREPPLLAVAGPGGEQARRRPVPAWSRVTSPLAVRLSRRTRTGCRASEGAARARPGAMSRRRRRRRRGAGAPACPGQDGGSGRGVGGRGEPGQRATAGRGRGGQGVPGGQRGPAAGPGDRDLLIAAERDQVAVGGGGERVGDVGQAAGGREGSPVVAAVAGGGDGGEGEVQAGTLPDDDALPGLSGQDERPVGGDAGGVCRDHWLLLAGSMNSCQDSSSPDVDHHQDHHQVAPGQVGAVVSESGTAEGPGLRRTDALHQTAARIAGADAAAGVPGC